MTSIGSIHNRGDFTITVADDIEIDEIVSSHATIISTGGSIIIKKKIDDCHINGGVSLQAARDIRIGEKIDNHSNVTAFASGSITIGQKIDNHSTAYLNAYKGGITIGQKIDQYSNAQLYAQTIQIGQKVDQHSDVHLFAEISIDVVQGVDGNAIVVWRAPTIICPISDGGSLWQWPLNAVADRLMPVRKRTDEALERLPAVPHGADREAIAAFTKFRS